MGWIGERLEPLKPAFEVVGAALGFVFSGPILKAIGALGKLGGVFRLVGGVAKVLSVPIRALGAAFGFVFRHAARVAAFIGGKVFGLFRRLPVILGKAASAFGGFASRAWGFIRDGVGRILGFLGGLGGRFLDAGKKLVSKLVEGVKGIGQAVVRAFAAFRSTYSLTTSTNPETSSEHKVPRSKAPARKQRGPCSWWISLSGGRSGSASRRRVGMLGLLLAERDKLARQLLVER